MKNEIKDVLGGVDCEIKVTVKGGVAHPRPKPVK